MEENKDLEINLEDEKTGNEEENELTLEEVMAELAKERAEKERFKNSLDKATSEAANYKKKLREKQTAEEQEAEAKREQEENFKNYVKGLENRIALSEATERYMGLGMSKEFASETAKLELEGDREAVTVNMNKHMENMIKAKEAEWLASRPPVNAGQDDGKDEDPFLKGFNG
ncbi:MAG: hypothetical protein KH020_12845 [Clostridiales bacterium]|nr:hypothetical protein [Clostridiales bacterium]